MVHLHTRNCHDTSHACVTAAHLLPLPPFLLAKASHVEARPAATTAASNWVMYRWLLVTATVTTFPNKATQFRGGERLGKPRPLVGKRRARKLRKAAAVAEAVHGEPLKPFEGTAREFLETLFRDPALPLGDRFSAALACARLDGAEGGGKGARLEDIVLGSMTPEQRQARIGSLQHKLGGEVSPSGGEPAARDPEESEKTREIRPFTEKEQIRATLGQQSTPITQPAPRPTLALPAPAVPTRLASPVPKPPAGSVPPTGGLSPRGAGWTTAQTSAPAVLHGEPLAPEPVSGMAKHEAAWRAARRGPALEAAHDPFAIAWKPRQ